MRHSFWFGAFLLGAMALGTADAAWAQTEGGAAAPTGGAQAEQVVLRPGDVLSIRVWPNAEFSGEFAVEESGYVYLPYLQEVRAGGVSIQELRDQLRRGYGEAMRNPVVTVTPMYRVTVTGEVQRPGVHTITPTHSLFDVLGLSGGFRPAADAENLRVVRAGEVIAFDALRVLETGQGMDAIQLRSGDHIVVPPRPSPLFTWSRALTVLQTAALILVTYERVTR